MPELRIWPSVPGIISMTFLAASATGGIFVGVDFWYQAYKEIIAHAESGAFLPLIFMIIAMASALWFLLALIFSFFKSTKALHVVFSFLAMISVLIPTILLGLFFSNIIAEITTGTFDLFIYVNPDWYASFPLDFIGFWLGVGGGLIAFITGFFIPSKESAIK